MEAVDKLTIADAEKRYAPDDSVKVPCEVYSRVVGYLRPVESWNEGKRQEYADRVPFKMPKIEAE